MTRHRGMAVAVMVAAATVALQYHRYREHIGRFSRFELPAFDPYVYVAMAERPSFFTVAPWGYRILTPWVVHGLPGRNVVRGYRLVTAAGLVAAGGLLFLYLRRLGHGEWASVLAVAVFGMSGPVGESVQSLFVSEPLSLLLTLGFLLAIERRAGTPLLALLAALLALSKEIWVLLLPLVYLARRDRGRARAWAAVAAVGLPALLAGQAVHRWWVPHIQPPHAPIGFGLLGVAWEGLRRDWSHTWPALFLHGLSLAALLGALRGKARPFLARYGYLLAALVLLSLGAWIYIPAPTVVPLFGPNTLRLMVYSLPFLLSLALFALDRVWPHWSAPPPLALAARPAALAAVGLAACLAFPFLALDRYRRLPLHHYRDGPLVLTLCRESLRSARRLQMGREVRWDLEAPGFDREDSDPRQMPRMRWFLREGWGPRAHYGGGPVVMHQGEASLLLPCLEPRELEARLLLEGAAGETFGLKVNGRSLGQGTQAGGSVTVRVPAAFLFRGDNLLTLSASSGRGGARLRAVAYGPPLPSPPE